jgi:hypothetical protein
MKAEVIGLRRTALRSKALTLFAIQALAIGLSRTFLRNNVSATPFMATTGMRHSHGGLGKRNASAKKSNQPEDRERAENLHG